MDEQPCSVGMLDEQIRQQCCLCQDDFAMDCECDFGRSVASQARFWLDESRVVSCIVDEHLQIDNHQVSRPSSLDFYYPDDKNATRLAFRAPGQRYCDLVADSHTCWFVLDSMDDQDSLDSLTDKAFAALDAMVGLGLGLVLAVKANSLADQVKQAKKAKPGSKKAASLADNLRSQAVLALAKLKHACQTQILAKLTNSAPRLVQLHQLGTFDKKLAQQVSAGLSNLMVNFAASRTPLLHHILANNQKPCCHVSKK
jgi:hypothetical protein